LTKYECAPSGDFDCEESDCAGAVGGVVACWADAGPARAASVETVSALRQSLSML
jgi:hypothetical protein